MTTLAPYLSWLEAAWNGGCHNGAALWRRLQAEGFGGSLPGVTEWTTRRRCSEAAVSLGPRKPTTARQIAHLMLAEREQLSRPDALTIATAEAAVPALSTARNLVERFQKTLRGGGTENLTAWINEARGSLVAGFGKGLAADISAVAAALPQPASNGQTEGTITKLKLLRRQMYGRGKLDLLRARLVATA